LKRLFEIPALPGRSRFNENNSCLPEMKISMVLFNMKNKPFHPPLSERFIFRGADKFKNYRKCDGD
jgi:hypothetical protein